MRHALTTADVVMTLAKLEFDSNSIAVNDDKEIVHHIQVTTPLPYKVNFNRV